MRACELFQQGWRQQRIAEALGVTPSPVSQWLRRVREGGASALRHRKPPGKPARLTPEQQAKVPELLRRGAPAFGFHRDRWTQKRVREVLRREFGVTYHSSHISRLLARWGWSRQCPARRARQRDEAAIRTFWEQTYPALEKGAREGLIFVDEVGFYLLPLAVATYAPRGETPVLAETVTHDHLAVISGVTPAGKLYRQIHAGPSGVPKWCSSWSTCSTDRR